MLAVRGFRAQMVAVLHDVLEDTEVTVNQLRETALPDEVVTAILVLTHNAEHTYEEYVEQVAGNSLARAVKLADLVDNLANNQRLDRSPEVVARIDRYEQAVRRLRQSSS